MVTKIATRLFLGSAAGLAAMTGAQAADLPVKAKPVEYVKICSLYGAGLLLHPRYRHLHPRWWSHPLGSVDQLARHRHSELGHRRRPATRKTRDRDIFFVRNRVFLQPRHAHADERSARCAPSRCCASRPTRALAWRSGAGTTAIDTGIIQWGGFSIGRAGTSYFDNPWAYAYKWGPNGWYGYPDTAGGRFVAAYTHQFGNGISGTLSLEDNKKQQARNLSTALNALPRCSGVSRHRPSTTPRRQHLA